MTVRRSPAVFATLLLLVTAILSGCLGGAEDVEDAPASGATDDPVGEPSPDLTNVTDTGDGFANESVGHQPHMHDYWDGRERVTLLDDDVDVDTFRGLAFTFYQLFIRRQAAAGGAFATFPDGAIVYEGTGKLELTVTWEDPKVTGMSVRYRSAAGPDFSEVIPVAAGTPIEVDVTPEMTDMPHMGTSRWAFFFEPGGAGQTVLGPFHVKVDIVKMRDIMMFPGHPELFQGKHEKILLDADGTTQQENGASTFVGFLAGGDPTADAGIPPEEVVPMETQEMRVDLKVTSAAANLGEVSEIFLIYKSAETNRWRAAEHVSGDMSTGEFVFVLPVDMKMVDSPYAQSSQWRFDVRASSEVVDGSDFNCSGCTDAQLEYHMTVTAFDSPVLLTAGADDDDDDDAPAVAAALPRLA